MRAPQVLEDKQERNSRAIPDAQSAFGIGRSTAYRLIDNGKRKTVKIG